jgi:hypothetical protein
MEQRETTITDQVTFGLTEIDPARSVEVPLRDLLFAYKLIGELFMFFRSAENYPDTDAVQRLMGDSSSGALQLLKEAYYQRLWRVFPTDIDMALTEHELQCPINPPYYRP